MRIEEKAVEMIEQIKAHEELLKNPMLQRSICSILIQSMKDKDYEKEQISDMVEMFLNTANNRYFNLLKIFNDTAFDFESILLELGENQKLIYPQRDYSNLIKL